MSLSTTSEAFTKSFQKIDGLNNVEHINDFENNASTL